MNTGYTHVIKYTRTIPKNGGPLAGMAIASEFRTTADAVKLHVEGLKRNPQCSHVRAERIK